MSNRLANETSAYLRQHAPNPVDWFPWGDEAWERARREDKPVLVSIGYSSCHWCHVMERESFENANIARLMNESIVAIKVDREERPDVDQIYMEARQRMTGSGGPPPRGLRRRAEVPDRDEPRGRAGRGTARHRARRRARPPDLHAREDGARGDLRSARRRLPPLLDRRILARAALREDALRQRAAPARVCRGVPADGRREAALAGRGDDRLARARDARPRGWLLRESGRGQRGRGGALLRVEPRRDSRRARAGAGRRVLRCLRRRVSRQLRTLGEERARPRARGRSAEACRSAHTSDGRANQSRGALHGQEERLLVDRLCDLRTGARRLELRARRMGGGGRPRRGLRAGEAVGRRTEPAAHLRGGRSEDPRVPRRLRGAARGAARLAPRRRGRSLSRGRAGRGRRAVRALLRPERARAVLHSGRGPEPGTPPLE